METIEITVEKRVAEKVSIELPVYRKTNAHHYKVIDKDNAISVHTGFDQNERSIGRVHVGCALDGTEESTAEEFDTAFAEACSTLSGLVSGEIKAPFKNKYELGIM